MSSHAKTQAPPDTEPLERLAREIWAFWRHNDERSWREIKATDPVWTGHVHWVMRSLILALREPSEAMVRAGLFALELEDGWRAMIDELLKEIPAR